MFKNSSLTIGRIQNFSSGTIFNVSFGQGFEPGPLTSKPYGQCMPQCTTFMLYVASNSSLSVRLMVPKFPHSAPSLAAVWPNAPPHLLNLFPLALMRVKHIHWRMKGLCNTDGPALDEASFFGLLLLPLEIFIKTLGPGAGTNSIAFQQLPRLFERLVGSGIIIGVMEPAQRNQEAATYVAKPHLNSSPMQKYPGLSIPAGTWSGILHQQCIPSHPTGNPYYSRWRHEV